jgi:hypothetical protein
MFLNFITSVTNFTAYFPIYTSFVNNDIITTSCLSFVATMSTFSHLVENHKHGMSGIGCSKELSIITNKLDVLGCVIMIGRLGYLYYYKMGFSPKLLCDNKTLFMITLLLFICNKLSEYDNQNVKLRNRYVVLHSIWHMGIYLSINKFLHLIYT